MFPTICCVSCPLCFVLYWISFRFARHSPFRFPFFRGVLMPIYIPCSIFHIGIKCQEKDSSTACDNFMDFKVAQSRGGEPQEAQDEVKELGGTPLAVSRSLGPPGLPSGSGPPENPSSYRKPSRYCFSWVIGPKALSEGVGGRSSVLHTIPRDSFPGSPWVPLGAPDSS